MSAQTHRRQGGFSLVELSIAMVIIGVIGLFIWRWVADSRAPMTRIEIQRQLAEAEAAVEGFVLARHRLPCAASSSLLGSESCGDISAVALPWRTLGLDSSFAGLHFGVNGGGGVDLSVQPPASASPDLNISFSGVPVLPGFDAGAEPAAARAAADAVQSEIDRAVARRAAVNGLDWCRVLRRYAENPLVGGSLRAGNASGDVAVAFVVAHPGENRRFEGSNVVGGGGAWRFDLPGRPQSADFDDISLAVGPADLAGRMGCVARLSAMQAAAQGAYAAYDNARVMQEYWSLRLFDIAQAESALEGAETGVIMSAMGLALATASTVISIASAANTEGVTAFTVAMAAVNMAMAIADVALSAEGLLDAQEGLAESQAKLAASHAYATQVYNSLADALRHAIVLDEKGLNP